jgi:ABC-type lipoprotein release transport system permease subunit
VAGALVLSLLAVVYPSWRAGRVAPAEVLRYE